MATIDKGEKHLFRRRLLDSSDNPIVWDDVVDITFELSLFGERTVQTWSKSGGGVTQDGDYTKFEYDSADARTGDYNIRATLVVNDSTWENDLADDVTWETDKITIVDVPTPYNTSSSTADIKFDVNVESALEAPTDAPGAGTPTTTANTASIPFSPVARASFYQYEIESNPGVWVSNGSSTTVNLTSLTGNTTDRIRLRGGNSTDTGPESAYVSYTTNPSVTPTLVGSVTTDTNSADYSIEDEGLEVEYFRDGSWISLGVVTDISLSGLAENTAFAFEHRFRNAGGVSLDEEGDPITSTISFTTQQAAPSTAPTLSVNTIRSNGADINRTPVAGADDYEASTDSGSTYSSVGLLSTFPINGQAVNTPFTVLARAVNDGGEGPDSNELTILTLPGSITLEFVEASDTSITYNVVAGAGTGSLTYAVSVDGEAYETVTVGENTKTGLANPSTSYTFTVKAANSSGDGAETTFNFSTTAAITEPTWTTGSFTNDLTSATLPYSGGGPNYEIRVREIVVDSNGNVISIGSYGSVIDNATATEYVVATEPLRQYDVGVRSTNGTTQSAWVTIRVQGNGFEFVEESQSNTFTTA